MDEKMRYSPLKYPTVERVVGRLGNPRGHKGIRANVEPEGQPQDQEWLSFNDLVLGEPRFARDLNTCHNRPGGLKN